MIKIRLNQSQMAHRIKKLFTNDPCRSIINPNFIKIKLINANRVYLTYSNLALCHEAALGHIDSFTIGGILEILPHAPIPVEPRMTNK
jgi:hypothetical protein